jgi:RND family efflux transporter MFP subunit
MNWKKTLLICVVILLGGGAITAFIFFTEPTASREGAVRETAMLVEVTGVEHGTFHPTIEAMGTVEPSQDILLSPQVGGEVIRRAPAFTPGGYVRAGETLLQIDPSDYEHALRQRQSALSQAVADLDIEMGQQAVAQHNYQSFNDTLPDENEALVLRKPQLDVARAQVEAARAAVAQAELALQRTTVKAPFDAHILSRNVNLGSQVSPGDNLGRLVGLDTYWVAVSVPLSELRWLSIPEGGQANGSEVRIRNPTAWDEGEYREGHLYRLVGALEDQTRMARVLVSVPDPHAYRADDADAPPLIIGSFVEAHIRGKAIADVVRLDRDYLRNDETVWVMEDGRLRIRDVDIVFRDADYAYINGGLRAQDQVVTTNLTTVADGARLRLEGSGSPSEPQAPSDSTR